MKNKKLINTTREVVESVTCDICKGKVVYQENGEFEYSQVELRYSRGNKYPDGGFLKMDEYDICEKCFTGKVQAFLKSLGAEPFVTEWDY